MKHILEVSLTYSLQIPCSVVWLLVTRTAHKPFSLRSCCVWPCAVFYPSRVHTAVDGICLQTSESIGCAEELGLPAVVVLNKIDLLPEEEAAQVSLLVPIILQVPRMH